VPESCGTTLALGARPTFLRLNDVCGLLRISKPTLWRLRRTGLFPEQTELTDRVTAWRRSEIEDWLSERGTVVSPQAREHPFGLQRRYANPRTEVARKSESIKSPVQLVAHARPANRKVRRSTGTASHPPSLNRRSDRSGIAPELQSFDRHESSANGGEVNTISHLGQHYNFFLLHKCPSRCPLRLSNIWRMELSA
jgi:prophage regulatory protein